MQLKRILFHPPNYIVKKWVACVIRVNKFPSISDLTYQNLSLPDISKGALKSVSFSCDDSGI